MIVNEELSGEGSHASWQRFSVEFAYPVIFTNMLFQSANPVLRDTLSRLEPAKRHRMVVFLDAGVADTFSKLAADIAHYAETYADQLHLLVDPILMPGGETIKSDLHYIKVMQKVLSDRRVDRHSYVLGIGGGALLDAVGLVAATSHRGIRHVRIPTTVLSQNDSGVGVKNGINLFGQKNYFGTFAPPFAVLNDYAFIESLPVRDKIAGMAEAVKVALIRDATFYTWLEDHADELAHFKPTAMTHMIKRCAELHMHQIAHGGDPFERGSARPLDFGHWSAHRLETLTHYQVRHGEAVAIGIALDARYSVLSGLLEAGAELRICSLLEHLGFNLWHPELEDRNTQGEVELLQGLVDFREHLGGELTITLLASLGQGIEVHELDTQLIMESVRWLKQRAQQ